MLTTEQIKTLAAGGAVQVGDQNGALVQLYSGMDLRAALHLCTVVGMNHNNPSSPLVISILGNSLDLMTDAEIRATEHFKAAFGDGSGWNIMIVVSLYPAVEIMAMLQER